MIRSRPWAWFMASMLGFALGAQTPPPAPATHVADRAGVLSAAAAAQLTAQLETFEHDTSSQVVVWIERRLPAGAALEDYVNRTFQAWKIGQRTRDNGVLLAVFTEDRKLRIEVGYGLEGALPDALSGRIIANEITPRFKEGNYEAGIRAGVTAILAATRGEYRADRPGRSPRAAISFERLRGVALIGAVAGLIGGALSGLRSGVGGAVTQGFRGVIVGGLGHPFAYLFGVGPGPLFGLGILLLVWLLILSRGWVKSARGWSFDHSGRHSNWGGWTSGGGGFGGGSSGGFSGGGGSSGGGGASGSW
jgi:uncharacterized protein